MAAVGLDITDDYIAVHVEQSETVLIKPAVIGREKDGSCWYFGEDAYRAALSGTGIMTDRLLTLLKKDGQREMGGDMYTATELLSRLLSMLIEKALNDEGNPSVTHVTAALKTADRDLFDRVAACLYGMGYREDEITVMSHSEAFMYFVLSQDKSFYTGGVALFDLWDGGLSVYEFGITRGTGRQLVTCICTDEEGFRTEILRTDTGKTLGDRIMTETAKRHLDGKIFTTVFLTGNGFSKTEWAKEFVSYTCHRRKLMLEEGIFAIGASLEATADFSQYVFMCDTRVPYEMTMTVEIRGRDTELLLIPAGERWHNLKLTAEVMPCGQDYIDFTVTPIQPGAGKQKKRLMISGFPEREDRTLRLLTEIEAVSANAVKITVSDMGFGEIYPSSGVVLKEELEI